MTLSGPSPQKINSSCACDHQRPAAVAEGGGIVLGDIQWPILVSTFSTCRRDIRFVARFLLCFLLNGKVRAVIYREFCLGFKKYEMHVKVAVTEPSLVRSWDPCENSEHSR
ncbi:hypothetical protein AGIG_G9685 [Arapaima gigas]